MAEPLVSIIVPVYKAEKFLKRTLETLRNQTLSEIEIILVEDASPDKSGLLCDMAAEEDKRIRVIHKENEGAGYARNAGLAVAKGKYIAFMDADDYIEPDMYEKLYLAAEKHEVDLVLSGVIFEDGNVFSEEGTVTYKNYFDKDTVFHSKEEMKNLRLGIVGALPYEEEDSRYGMSVWKNLFRRDVIVENGLAFCSERAMLSEDALFMVDFIASAKSAVGIKGAFYHYCRNEESISKSYKKDRFEKGMVFVAEAEKRFRKDLREAEYQAYLDRFIQAFCRFLSSQEILYAREKGIPYKELRLRLKMICSHKMTKGVLKRYPIWKLPKKQAVFTLFMRLGLYRLMVLMVNLRSR